MLEAIVYCYEGFLDKGPSIKPGSIYSIMTTMVAENRSVQLFFAKHRATIDCPELG